MTTGLVSNCYHNILMTITVNYLFQSDQVLIVITVVQSNTRLVLVMNYNIKFSMIIIVQQSNVISLSETSVGIIGGMVLVYCMFQTSHDWITYSTLWIYHYMLVVMLYSIGLSILGMYVMFNMMSFYLLESQLASILPNTLVVISIGIPTHTFILLGCCHLDLVGLSVYNLDNSTEHLILYTST